MLRVRPDEHPGQWKEYVSQAGLTSLAGPGLVRGALPPSFWCYRILREPLARALVIIFLASEVQLVADGNSQLVRLLMHASPVSAGPCRPILTSHAREHYLDALRQLSRQNKPEPHPAHLFRGAQPFVAGLQPLSYESAKAQLKTHHALLEVPA